MARTTAARGANRARLIEAAYAVLAERGYEGTSVKAVAQVVSMGSVADPAPAADVQKGTSQEVPGVATGAPR